MVRYLGPRLRLIRRLGQLLGFTRKNSAKTNRPGQHGHNNKKSTTEYGIRLAEKQKLKINYGVTESQMRDYISEARRMNGATGVIMLQLLEMRLDTICFNLGFAPTIVGARQLVNHGHILINGSPINIASFHCRIKDVITVRKKARSENLVKKSLENNLKNNISIPSHLKLDSNKLEGTVLNYCARKDIPLEINEMLIVEFYSRSC